MPHDFYEILGVDPDADEKSIKKAYRSIIKYCHPDSPDCRMTNDELLQVQEAYQTLVDPERRARYDRRRNAPAADALRARRGPTAGPFGHRSAPTPHDFFRDFFSILDDPFGAFSMPDFLRRDRTYSQSLEIILTHEEARRGGDFEITVPGPGGIPTGSITLRIPPHVRSGTAARVDLSRALGIRGVLFITVLVEEQ
jgi:molecular chaperone DnaJ